MSNNYIEIKNVSKVIKGNCVLDNVTANFEEGKVYGIQGINGSGKTMLLRAIAGLIKYQGEIKVEQVVINNKNFPKDMGILIENPSFLNEFTGRENLQLLSLIQSKIRIEQIDEAIKMVGLNPEDKRRFGKYSLGMKQRLGIAQAIVGNPKLILLDEPTNAIDADGISMLTKLIKELNTNGSTIIITSHDKEFLEGVADQTYTMEMGRLK